MSERRSTLDVGGTPLVVREWGAASARPLVSWPALNMHAHAQLDEAGPVWAAQHGLRAVAPSPPGWETPALAPDDYRPRALARQIVGLLDALELERVAFVGCSWGASIGCHLATLAPSRLNALVLLEAGYTDFQDQPGFRERTVEELSAELRAERARFAWPAYLDAQRTRARAWRPALELRVRAGVHAVDGALVPRVAPEVVAAAARGVAVERPSETLADLNALDVPILLLTAGDTLANDWAQRALARFRAAVPRADVEEIRDSGHDLLADALEETTRRVAEWLGARR